MEGLAVRYIFFSVVIFIFINSTFLYANDDSKPLIYKFEGSWKIDIAETVALRIKYGVPWHIGERMPESLLITFKGNKYQITEENTAKIRDIGRFEIHQGNEDEAILRLFPENNRFNSNSYKFEELLGKFTSLGGDRIPFCMGLKFKDKNTIHSFSLVRGIGEEFHKAVKKDDNIIWKKVQAEKP
jgi:hypothetical protein